MSVLIQPSFAKGEISPELHGRVDTSMYAISLATARNAIVHTYGGLSKRPGLRYLGPVADHSYAPRLIPFEFNTTDQYILEFGNMYMRVIRNDAQVLEPSINISNVEILPNTRITTSVPHGYSNDQEVYLSGMSGLTFFNGRRYRITSVTSTTFRIKDQVTNEFVSTIGETYNGGGAARRVYEIATPYAIADVFDLNFVQSADVMTIVHNKYPIYELSRLAHTDWRLTRATFVNSTAVPKGMAGNVDKTNTKTFTADEQELLVATSGSSKVLNIHISGTYDMEIRLEKEEGVVSPSWKTISTYSTPNATVNTTYTTGNLNERVRLRVNTYTSGSATVTLQEDRSVKYTVTAVNLNTGEESLPGLAPAKSISTITNAALGRVTFTGSHGMDVGDGIYLSSIQGMTQLNGNRYTVNTIPTSTSITLALDGVPVNTTDFGVHVAGTGSGFPTFIELNNVPQTGMQNTITWTSAFAGAEYNVFKQENGIYGLIGTTAALTFTDTNIEPELGETPPSSRNPFITVDDRPRAVGYYEQRRVFGGTNNAPDTSEFSQIGRHSNFAKSSPAKDDDAITATLSSDSVNEIRHYVPFSNLLVFTSGAEWVIKSGPDSVFSPDTIRQAPQTTWGSSRKKPIRIGNTALFLTPDEANVRSIGYSYEIDGYTGSNLNTMSRHMLAGKTVKDWCYVRNPDSRIYLTRNDGIGISVAFDQEQEVVAWTTMDTSGNFESCASLRGAIGGVDPAYFVVHRRVGGHDTRYIEVMRQSNIEDIKDSFFVDSGLSLNVPLVITDVQKSNPVRVYVTAHGLVEGDEVDISGCEWEPLRDEWGDEYQPNQLNGRFTVYTVSTDSFTLKNSHGDNIDSSLFTTYIGNGVMRKVINTVIGLHHLEGRDVVVLSDGNVITGMKVTNARVNLPHPASRVHVGLPYITDIEPLNIEAGRGTVQSLIKRIPSVTLRLFKSRGIWVGPNKDNLVELKTRTNELWGNPSDLITGDIEQAIHPEWNSRGRIFIRAHLPLPFTLLAIIPQLEIEDD